MHPYLPFIISQTTPQGAPPPLETVKLAKVVKDETAYTAFGVSVQIDNNHVVHYTRRGWSHVEAGFIHGLPYNVASDTWDITWPLVDGDVPPDHRDAWGGGMDNGDIIIFNQFTWNNLFGGDWSSLEIYYRRANVSAPYSFGPRISLWDVNPSMERLYRGTIYGKPEPLGPPGAYVILFHQWNEAGATGSAGTPRFLTYMLITDDYFNTFDFKVMHDGPEGIGEGCVTYIGGDNYLVICRRDGVGLLVYESTDGGDTWTDRGRCNLRYYDNEDGIITQPVWEDGLLHIMYQNRSSGYIELSRNNDPAVFFNQVAIWGQYKFNEPELWYKNNTLSDGIFVGLGYGDMIPVGDPVRKEYLICWSREDNRNKAVLMWTRCPIDVDPNPPDTIPVIASSYVSSTRIRFDIPRGNGVTGYTEEQFLLPRYYVADLATDPTFTTFPTVNWHAILPNQTIHNMRVNSDWMLFNELTPNTTYYFRMKAVNLAGQTTYTTTSVTTLP